jgi:hypothetical protein
MKSVATEDSSLADAWDTDWMTVNACRPINVIPVKARRRRASQLNFGGVNRD